MIRTNVATELRARVVERKLINSSFARLLSSPKQRCPASDPFPGILRSLSHALRLNDDERTYVSTLLRCSGERLRL